MSSSVSFSDDGASVITRKAAAGSTPGVSIAKKTPEEIERFYELKRCSSFVTVNGYHRVALQFPDTFLCNAAHIALKLRESTQQEVFIMADTSYGSCCVDEVAAEHVQADCIIHFGPSCLTQTKRLPVLYVFGDEYMDVEHCAAAFKELFPDNTDHLLVLYDTSYSHCIDKLREALTTDYRNCVFSNLIRPSTLNSQSDHTSSDVSTVTDTTCRVQRSNKQCSRCGTNESKNCDTETSPTKDIDSEFEGDLCKTSMCACEDRTSTCTTAKVEQGRENMDGDDKERVRCKSDDPSKTADTANYDQSSSSTTGNQIFQRFGRAFSLPRPLESYKVFFVGGEGQTLTNLILNYNKCQFYSYNPVSRETRRETLNVNRALGRRYYLVQKAKEARTVGILVGTLGAANYMESIQRLKELMKQAGKKHYTIAVGKLNVPKMANFLEIDVFVLVACPENSLLNSQEFFKPVVTPYEMEIACIRSREWTGYYTTDFRELLPGAAFYVPTETETDTEVEPEYSLITGGLLPTSGDSQEEQGVSSTALVQRSKMEVALQNSAAASFLNKRTWQGLEQQLGQTEVTMATEGLSGVAAGYSHEPSVRES